MKIGIDNYCLYPKNFGPVEMIQWAVRAGAEGVAFSGLTNRQYEALTPSLLKEIASLADDNNLYLEWGGGQHIPYDLNSWTEKDIFNNNLKRAEEASSLNTRIIRSCSGGLMRWRSDSLSTGILMEKTAEALAKQKKILQDHDVVLAIETHFEFTSFELLNIFETAGLEPGGCIGICLDTMNLLVMLEDPVAATKRLLPWIVSTHIKDGGIYKDSKGLHPFPCELGRGIIDLNKIISLLHDLPGRVDLSVEDHGGNFDLPIYDPGFMAEFPDSTSVEMDSLHSLAAQTAIKLKNGSIAVVDRETWPKICEVRTRKDINSVKELTKRN